MSGVFSKAAAMMALGLALAGCQTMDRPAFSRAELRAASPALRFDTGNDEDGGRFIADVRAAAVAPRDGTFDLLALSSGGANGAYGAGVLTGWSERGDRPEFEVVTGVSIGALIAPFAFIGKARDPDLQAAFTDGRTSDLLQSRWAMALFGPGLYRAAPLRTLVEKAVDDDLMAQVAAGHRTGRRLYVATTSLDTQEQVIWDMGALAASGRPDARARFIDILTAASSVPGAFPPVFVDLENDGRRLRELHADGRVTANFFIAPESVLRSREPVLANAETPGRIWVVINGTPDESFDVAPYSGVAVAARSLEAMLNASTRISLIATAQFARQNGMELSVATSGPEGQDRPFDFNRARMNMLYETGRAAMKAGDAWSGGGVAGLNL